MRGRGEKRDGQRVRQVRGEKARGERGGEGERRRKRRKEEETVSQSSVYVTTFLM